MSLAGRPRFDPHPDLRVALLAHRGQGHTIEECIPWLRQRGVTVSRSALSIWFRCQPGQEGGAETVLQEAVREAAREQEQQPAEEADEPEEESGSTDTLEDLREAQQLMKALAKRMVAHVAKGGGSERDAMRAVDTYANLTLKIRKMEKAEQPKKQGRVVICRLPAKEEMQ